MTTWSKRTARDIRGQLGIIESWILSDVETYGSRPLKASDDPLALGQLPRVTWWGDEAFRRNLARAARYLGSDDVPRPRCTGEEWVLHLAISLSDLPAKKDLYQELYDDTDFLLMGEPALDGIEGDAGFAELAGTANLEVKDWFTPFYESLPRDYN